MPWPKGRTYEQVEKKNTRIKARQEDRRSNKPTSDINIDELLDLAKIQCTYSEIAACLNTSVDTLEQQYSDIITKGYETGKMSLRRIQYKIADSGSSPMAIFLGKVYLKQKDNEEVSPQSVALLLKYADAVQLEREKMKTRSEQESITNSPAPFSKPQS